MSIEAQVTQFGLTIKSDRNRSLPLLTTSLINTAFRKTLGINTEEYKRVLFSESLQPTAPERIREMIDLDYYMMQWGSELFKYKLGNIDLEKIRNIRYYSSSDASSWTWTTGKVSRINLDQLAPPLRSPHLEYWTKIEGVTAEFSRGCPHVVKKGGCLFCPHPGELGFLFGYGFKRKIYELIYLSAMGLRSLVYIDEEFFGGTNKESLLDKIEFFMMLIEYKKRGWIIEKMYYCLDCRVDTICALDDLYQAGECGSIHPLQLAYEAGIRYMFVGFESMDTRVLKHMNKGTSKEMNLRALKLLRRYIKYFQVGSLSLLPLLEYPWVRDSLRVIVENDIVELADPSLPMILFKDSLYWKRYFDGDKNKERRERLLIDYDENKPRTNLDALSGVRYRFKDPRIGALADINRFHSLVMYPVMKSMRSLVARLAFGGESGSQIHKAIWDFLTSGRRDIIIYGMMELCKIIDQEKTNKWQQKVISKRQKIFIEMTHRVETILHRLERTLDEVVLTENQVRIIEPDSLRGCIEEVRNNCTQARQALASGTPVTTEAISVEQRDLTPLILKPTG